MVSQVLNDQYLTVAAFNKVRENTPADRQRYFILNTEVASVVSGVVAAVVEESCLAAMLLHAANQHRAVFASDFGIHVTTDSTPGTEAAACLTASTASSSPLYVTASPIRVSRY